MSQKIALVTGATDGIGKATAQALAEMGARVLLHGRDKDKGQSALEEIRRATGNDHLEFYQADFRSLAQVRGMAAEILDRHDELSVLINNAGIYMKQRQETADGFEVMFAVNYLSAFLLTNLMLDILKVGAPARVITVSSGMQSSARLEWDNLQGQKHFSPSSQYALTKLLDVMFTNALARRMAGQQVTANSLNPGVVATKMLREGWGMAGGSSPREGARGCVYLAASPEVEDVTGAYFAGERPSRSNPASYDVAAQERLWELSVEMAGLIE